MEDFDINWVGTFFFSRSGRIHQPYGLGHSFTEILKLLTQSLYLLCSTQTFCLFWNSLLDFIVLGVCPFHLSSSLFYLHTSYSWCSYRIFIVSLRLVIIFFFRSWFSNLSLLFFLVILAICWFCWSLQRTNFGWF